MPDSNVELQLRKLNGEEVTLPKPQSRVELYLAKLNGEDVVLPEPHSRVEQLLFKLTQKSGDGGASAFVNAIINSMLLEKVDIILPDKFNQIVSELEPAPEPDLDNYFSLPAYIKSATGNTMTVVPRLLCAYTSLESANFPKATIVGANAFDTCVSLVSINMPLINKACQGAFANCPKMTSYSFPVLKELEDDVFRSNDELLSLDLPSLEKVAGAIFYESKKLTSIKMGKLIEVDSGAFRQTRLTKDSALSYIEIGEGTSADLYIQYSTKYTQAVLHAIIENLADLSSRETPGIFNAGSTNIDKIDDSHKTMLTAKNWDYS